MIKSAFASTSFVGSPTTTDSRYRFQRIPRDGFLRAFYLDFLAKQYRWPRVRMKIRPSAIAGVAAVVSFNSFFPNTFSLGPSFNTTIVPFSPCT